MHLKKLVAGLLIVVALLAVGIGLNSTSTNKADEAFATTYNHENATKKTDLKTATQAREFLANKYGDAGWTSTYSSKDKKANLYWTFVATKDSANGLVKAGHTLYVHDDGTVVY
ncbi:hypothetical protein [Companilactobacillus mishanensis]|uniref:Uncharacterized protein n=1 Tax=Companilactobacillus mishanensis TaxID=2486008 RepID=A0A5P0ZJ53_9LACO|nr:hypothetical protein [Companilactobacillus mishanensis]MQS53129.1 hypothetical protein [Companilactobacillus mishanensis]